METKLKCADCGCDIVDGPDWQLEDGRTVCHACCVADTRRFVDAVIQLAEIEIPGDWESHLPDVESLHEWLEAQQRGE